MLWALSAGYAGDVHEGTVYLDGGQLEQLVPHRVAVHGAGARWAAIHAASSLAEALDGWAVNRRRARP
ncbi:MAG: hypothetical protein ACLSVD_09100 [Eggerthellaceae bacterium]